MHCNAHCNPLPPIGRYGWLYLHMPLTMSVMLLGDSMANGITIETLQFVRGRADWHRACLCCSTAAFHLLLGTVHVLSAPGASPVNKKKRCIVRFLSAASLLPVAGTSWEAVSVLLYISVVCITEVLSRVELATQVSALAFAIACPPTAP